MKQAWYHNNCIDDGFDIDIYVRNNKMDKTMNRKYDILWLRLKMK